MNSETCPFCGDDWLDLFHGLEVWHSPDGIDRVGWIPCCLAFREYVELEGWVEAFGLSLEADLRRIGIGDVREVYLDDSLVRYRLQGSTPGLGVAGWRSEVFDEINRHHKHHKAPPGWKFGVAVYNGAARVGVAVVGRPVARKIQEAEPSTLEVTRICTWGDTRLRRNAVSKLLALCVREARKLGARKLITYTLESESGSSLKASNWRPVARTKGGSWDRPGRRRVDKAPMCCKIRWEIEIKPKGGSNGRG
jgi:hypothetical protein